MDDLLADRAKSQPDAPALIDGVSGHRIPWAELDDRAARLARQLAGQGVGRGSRVALVDRRAPRVAAALHACVRLGAALVPLDPSMPAPELARTLQACDPVVLLRGDEGLQAIPGGLPAPSEALDGGSRDAAIIHTSGSAGRPKAVRLTYANCMASARGCAEALGGVSADDRWLLCLGTHRIGGLAIVWRSAATGAAVVHVDRFEEGAVAAALEHRPTLASLVPVMLHRLLEAGLTPALRGLRAILVGGAGVSKAEAVAWAEAGLAVSPSYGMTETGSQVSVVPPGRALELAGTAGVTHSRAALEIDGLDGEPGEILAGGPVLSPGYLDAELTSSSFAGEDASRRLRTGDIGVIRAGVLTVTGRRGRMIVTGGEKVSPEEVEGVLLAHPGVREAMVTGQPDPRYGSIVSAVVAGDAGPEELARWCSERLTRYKVPRRIEVVTAIPRSEDGKMLLEPTEPAPGP